MAKPVLHQEHSYARHLAKRVKNGELIEITMFKLEFQWLSNFYWHYRMLYTVEHEFQSAKTSGVLARLILDAETPGVAKRLGRTAQLPRDWDENRIPIMKRCLEHKFNMSPMREWLIATSDIPLIEGNFWHDNYWGSCGCGKCKSAPGNNNLGKLLMEVRSELRKRENGRENGRLSEDKG